MLQDISVHTICQYNPSIAELHYEPLWKLVQPLRDTGLCDVPIMYPFAHSDRRITLPNYKRSMVSIFPEVGPTHFSMNFKINSIIIMSFFL